MFFRTIENIMDRAVPEFPSEFILCIDKVKKRRCSIRIWVLIINDSFKKSSRAFTGLGPSEEPGELIVENVPLKWVPKIHWKSQFDFFENFKLSSDEFSQSGFSEECGVFPDIWIKNGSGTFLTFIVTKNLNSNNLKNHPFRTQCYLLKEKIQKNHRHFVHLLRDVPFVSCPEKKIGEHVPR